MPTYFKPWRRKFGVLTLMMACVFMAAWARSWSYVDEIRVFRGEQIVHSFVSGKNWFLWRMPKTYDDTRPATFRILRDVSACPRCDLPYDSPDNPPVMSFDIHYSAIAIPLTLLSAWLLLSKPQTPKKPPAEST